MFIPSLTSSTLLYPFFGIAGTLFLIIGMIIPALFYRGKQQEKYSPFNHFISELGEVGVSRAALVFNACLVIGGITYLPFINGLGLELHSIWGWIASLAGAWASISCLLVGVFPMNNLAPHVRAAISFFRSGLVTMLLFSVAIFTQPAGGEAIPRWAGYVGVFSVLCFAAFLFLPRKAVSASQEEMFSPEFFNNRPRFWALAWLEWMVFFSTILWFMVIGISTL